jgi:hypothetical protein
VPHGDGRALRFVRDLGVVVDAAPGDYATYIRPYHPPTVVSPQPGWSSHWQSATEGAAWTQAGAAGTAPHFPPLHAVDMAHKVNIVEWAAQDVHVVYPLFAGVYYRDRVWRRMYD